MFVQLVVPFPVVIRWLLYMPQIPPVNLSDILSQGCLYIRDHLNEKKNHGAAKVFQNSCNQISHSLDFEAFKSLDCQNWEKVISYGHWS